MYEHRRRANDCQSDKLTVLAAGPDLRTIRVRCATCGREDVIVVVPADPLTLSSDL